MGFSGGGIACTMSRLDKSILFFYRKKGGFACTVSHLDKSFSRKKEIIVFIPQALTHKVHMFLQRLVYVTIDTLTLLALFASALLPSITAVDCVTVLLTGLMMILPPARSTLKQLILIWMEVRGSGVCFCPRTT